MTCTLERELEARLTALRRRRTPTQAPPPTTAPRLHPSERQHPHRGNPTLPGPPTVTAVHQPAQAHTERMAWLKSPIS
jgi:hypothetical protein